MENRRESDSSKLGKKMLSLRTIVHVYKVVHKFHIKVFSFVNRFIGVCQFEI